MLRFNKDTGKMESAALQDQQDSTPHKNGRRFYNVGKQANFLGWNTPTVNIDTAIYQNLNLMKGRCRDLARNNDYIIHFLRLAVSNVIGPNGIKFQSKLLNSKGLDRTFNKRLEQYYKSAGKLKNSPSLCGKMTRRDMQNLWLRTLIIDGEVIRIKYPGHNNRHRYASKLIDTALLDWQYNEVCLLYTSDAADD